MPIKIVAPNGQEVTMINIFIMTGEEVEAKLREVLPAEAAHAELYVGEVEHAGHSHFFAMVDVDGSTLAFGPYGTGDDAAKARELLVSLLEMRWGPSSRRELN